MRFHALVKNLEKHINEYGFLYLFFFLISPLYIFHLNNLSFAMQGDEAEIALQALQIFPHHTGVIGVGWSDLPLLSFLPHTFTMEIFGPTLIGQRMGSVIFGLLSLFIIYLLAKVLFNQRVGLLATIFLGSSHMWVAFSRLGLTNVQAAFVMLCCMYFTIYGIEKKKAWASLIGGAFLGLCLYSYFAARITPFIIIPYFIFTIISIKDRNKGLLLLLIFSISALCLAVPQLLFYVSNPHAFNDRTNEVYIFGNSLNIQAWRVATYPNMSTLEIIQKQFFTTINIFAGDQAGHYGYKGQLFDFATIILFFLGIFYTFFLSMKKWFLLMSWFVLVLLGSVLTSSPISLSRVVVGLPVIYLFVALGLEAVITKSRNWGKYISWGLLLVVGYIVFFNLTAYFISYPQQQLEGRAGDINALNATHIAYYLNAQPRSYKTLFLTPPNLYADFAPLVFLSGQTTRFNIQYPDNYPIPGVCPKDIIYIIYTQYQDKYEALRNACPHAHAFSYRSPQGVIQYNVIQTQLY